MINIGDTVKVIAATEDASYCDGRKRNIFLLALYVL